MADVRGIVSKLASGRGVAGAGGGTGRRRPASGGLGAGGAGTGRRTQDEAIGRGVRGLLGRFRR